MRFYASYVSIFISLLNRCGIPRQFFDYALFLYSCFGSLLIEIPFWSQQTQSIVFLYYRYWWLTKLRSRPFVHGILEVDHLIGNAENSFFHAAKIYLKVIFQFFICFSARHPFSYCLSFFSGYVSLWKYIVGSWIMKLLLCFQIFLAFQKIVVSKTFKVVFTCSF